MPSEHLYDYIATMELQRANNDAGGGGGGGGVADVANQDLYTQLAQKEQDLLLAAQLGKALLEKNEELSMLNEKMAEDYSKQLEILEQEKHVLRRKLDSVEGEHESKVSELQCDIAELRKCLEEQHVNLKSGERAKSTIIGQLTEQNQRLSAQLKDAMKNEEVLSSQLQGLRDQFSLRKSNLQDHVGHLEIMREEVMMLTEKKSELERRMQHLLSEREGLSCNLDESSDRIMALERQCHEQLIHLRDTQRELTDLRTANGSLSEQLESISRPFGNANGNGNGHSLLTEMDLSATSSGHGSAASGAGSASSPHSHPSIQDDIEIDDIECDDPHADTSLFVEQQNHKLRQEVMDACVALRSLCECVRARRRRASLALSSLTSSNGAATEPIQDIRLDGKFEAGVLTYLVKEVEQLVSSSAWYQPDMSQCQQCGRSDGDILQLESQLHLTQEAADRLQRHLSDKSDELKRRIEDNNNCQNQLTLKELELGATREERDVARRDVEDTHLAKDEIIRRAWEVRDQAAARKNAAEIDLARTRIDNLQINSQLLEAIQQKIELSQQLDQWQVDMQQLIEEQMKSKLSKQEILRTSMEQNNQSSISSGQQQQQQQRRSLKFLGIFQRS